MKKLALIIGILMLCIAQAYCDYKLPDGNIMTVGEGNQALILSPSDYAQRKQEMINRIHNEAVGRQQAIDALNAQVNSMINTESSPAVDMSVYGN